MAEIKYYNLGEEYPSYSNDYCRNTFDLGTLVFTVVLSWFCWVGWEMIFWAFSHVTITIN
jgi:hypothetical protein